jgi:hypothetical protein
LSAGIFRQPEHLALDRAHLPVEDLGERLLSGRTLRRDDGRERRSQQQGKKQRNSRMSVIHGCFQSVNASAAAAG